MLVALAVWETAPEGLHDFVCEGVKLSELSRVLVGAVKEGDDVPQSDSVLLGEGETL